MENTLAQILNDMLVAQATVQRLQGELDALKAEHANCPKPVVEPANGASPEPWVDPLETALQETQHNDG